MNRQTLPALIRDLLTTGDAESRKRNAAWIRSLVDTYDPQDKSDLAYAVTALECSTEGNDQYVAGLIRSRRGVSSDGWGGGV